MAVTLALLSSAALYSCAGERDDSASAKAMYDEAVALLDLPADEEVYYMDASEEWYLFNEDVLSGKFGDIDEYPEAEKFADYAAYFSTTPYGPEFGIFRMTSEDAADEMKRYIKNRVAQMLRLAVNYPSVDTSLIKNYTVTTDGVWVYYAATADNSGINRVIEKKLYPKD